MRKGFLMYEEMLGYLIVHIYTESVRNIYEFEFAPAPLRISHYF
jgi:hypothetical protein